VILGHVRAAVAGIGSAAAVAARASRERDRCRGRDPDRPLDADPFHCAVMIGALPHTGQLSFASDTPSHRNAINF